MQPTVSSETLNETLAKGAVQPNSLFFCCKDKTIPYLTFDIKHCEVLIKMYCSHLADKNCGIYGTLLTKSTQIPKETPEEKSKCVVHQNEDAVGYCEHEQEHFCLSCFERHQRGFPENIPQNEEDKVVQLNYICKQHRTNKLNLYCNTCETNICSECKLTTHREHDTFNVTELVDNMNISEATKSIPQWEKAFYEDAEKKYNDARNQLDSAYQMYIQINSDFFGIAKSCFEMFEMHKESYDVNLYRNTANIANNFDFPFLKGLLHDENENGNTNTWSIASTIEYFSNRFILDITNIHPPNPSSISTSSTWLSPQINKINSQSIQPRDTPFEKLSCVKVPGKVNAVCKLNYSQFAVGCYEPNEIFIVDFNTLEILRTLKHHTSNVWRLYVHKRTRNLLSLSEDLLICVWDYPRGVLLKELKGHTGCVYAAAEWDNGDIVTVCYKGLIKHWEMTEYRCYQTIDNGNGWHDVILKAGKWITGGEDGIKYFKQDAKSKDDYLYHNKVEGKNICSWWWVDNRWWAGCNSGCIWIYDLDKLELQGEVKGHSAWIYNLILLGDDFVASGAYDYLVNIWDWEWKECKQTLELGGCVSTGWCEWDVNCIICGTWTDKSIKVFVRK